MLVKVLPKEQAAPSTPEQIVAQLHEASLKTEEQAARFSQLTGKSRRTFFDLRKKLGINADLRPAKYNKLAPKNALKRRQPFTAESDHF